jgi:DNA polymerase elongation subunit (family B)
MFRITLTQNQFRKSEDAIKKINNLGYINDYVYDLETDMGRFHAGVGSMIVKNTDSVFFSPKIHDFKTQEIQTDKEALKMCIELGQLAGEAICKVLPEPEEQVYEKTLWPFIILTKKRYVGNLYETNPDKYYQKSMGIVLKRRDNAKIVKIVVGGIVNKILNERSNKGAIEYCKTELKKILRDKYPIDKFIISKTLKGTYKDRTRIVHAVLADRIGERDPGNKPDINDRIPWVYIVPKGKALLQGDRVEDPKYVIENKLEIDYLFYITNQIMKPSIQFLELIAKNPEKIFENYINKEINRRKNVSSIYDYVIDKDDSSTNENINENIKDNKKNSSLMLEF